MEPPAKWPNGNQRIETFIHLNSPVHGIDQNAVGVTVHFGGDQQIQAKSAIVAIPTTAEQDHLQARPSR